jgi:hypothetical protein
MTRSFARLNAAGAPSAAVNDELDGRGHGVSRRGQRRTRWADVRFVPESSDQSKIGTRLSSFGSAWTRVYRLVMPRCVVEGPR